MQTGAPGRLPGGGELCTQILEKMTGTNSAMHHWRGPSCAEPGERVRAWCAMTEAGEGTASSTGSPSLLLGNFSSCFLGTSYLEKKGRETLKVSR